MDAELEAAMVGVRYEAKQAAMKVLWDKRSMMPENCEEIVDDVLAAALPIVEGALAALAPRRLL